MIEKVSAGKKTSYIISAVLGSIVGGLIGVLLKAGSPLIFIGLGALLGVFTAQSYKRKTESRDSATIQLREEQLDISKEKVQTGDVLIHKEIIQENKNIVVPITREELVVEQKVMDDSKVNETKTIRIPLNTQEVEVIKHPVTLEEVEVSKNQFTENKRIVKSVKKEKENIQINKDSK